jgi:hypothetical protein
MNAQQQTIRAHYRVEDRDYIGTWREVQSWIRVAEFFNKNSNPKITVHCSWRGQADLGFVEIGQVQDGVELVKMP